MQKPLLTTPYLSGFQIFLPHLPFPHSHILFPNSHPPSLNPFLIKLLVLHSHNLPYLSRHYNWDLKTLNLIRFVLGLHYEDFYMVESSLEEMLPDPNAMNLFYYIYLYLTDGVKEKRTLNEKRGYYKIILYWIMRKFNEYLKNYNKENIIGKTPVVPVIKGEFSKTEGSDIEMVGYLQSGYKELKDIIKREGHKEKIGWRLPLQSVRLEPIGLAYKGKSPIELLLEGNLSAILDILREKNYTLEKVQEEIKGSCLYFLAKGHFSLEFSVFLMEQSGLEVDQVLADYYCFTLRKDIRKKIAKYFKEKGMIENSLISPFIAFQEIFAPIDSITIALRRKYAASRVVGPMKRPKNLNNIWRGDSSQGDGEKGKPKNFMDLIEKARSYGHFVFEMDDLEEDEPGAVYLRREYEMTRYYRGERVNADEDRYEHRGVFSVEEFRKNDRRMYEVNMKMSFRGKDKFKPRDSGKKKSQEKLERYCQEIFKAYLGSEVKLPARILQMNRVKEAGYFQYKVKDVEEIDAKDMLGVLFERLKLGTEESLEIFEGLEGCQKRKYLEFLLEFIVERRDWKGVEEVLRWIVEKEEVLFKEYFGIGEERIIKRLPVCLSNTQNMRRFMEIMMKRGYNTSEEVIGIKEMIGLLARNKMIMRGEMKGIIRYFGEKKLKFVVISLLKGGCEADIERFLEESGIKIPEEKAVILSIKGDEKAFGGIISLWEEEAGGLSVKSKDLYWEYKICSRKCGAVQEKKEIPVFEVFRAGSLASYFLIGQISSTEDMSLANTELEIENGIEFNGLRGGENKTLEVRTISLMVQLGLPFAGFLSIYSDHPLKKLLLFGEREAFNLSDLETLTRELAVINEGNKDMKAVHTILRICFKAVLQNPFNLELFRSYLAFLKLLRLDPEPFLVNCLVYRRIFIFLGCKERTAAEIFKLYYYSENFLQAPKDLFVDIYNVVRAPKENKWIEEENKARVPEILEKMSGYFLEVYSQNIRGYGTQKGYNKRGTHLIEILEQLEEATISMESIMEVMKGEKELIKEMESPWGLVSKFCTLHNIPSSLKLLEEISAKNDWLKLLLELDVQKCSIETAKEFIHKYFHHIVLKKHLINSLEDEKISGRNREEWIEEAVLKEIEGIRMDDKGIIGVILKIREVLKKYEEGGGERVRRILGKGLVKLSEEINIEILCLMAEFVDEGEKEERYFKHLGIGRGRLQGEVPEIKGEEKWRKELGDLVYWCKKDMKELVKITRVYFGERSWVAFIEGIQKIFEGNVMEMKRKFARFVKEYRGERHADHKGVLLEPRFIEMFVKNLIYNEIFTEDQALGVLEALCKIRLSKQMEDWYVNLGVLRKMPKRIRSKGLIFNSFKIYLLLLEGEMFEEAEEFSTRYGFSKSYLALIQSQKLLVSGLQEDQEDHKGLIDQILVMLLKSEAKIYQTAYYLKYLTMKNERLSLWDHIYLLNIAYRLMEKMTGEKNEKFREKVRIQRDLLLYGNYWKDLRRYWFRNKERGHEKVLLEVRGRGYTKNVKVSEELEALVVKNFLCGLSNFDCEFVGRICERYGIMLLDNEIYAFWREVEETLGGVVVSGQGLFEVLGLFGMGAVGKVKTLPQGGGGEEFEEEMKREKLKEVVQGYMRVRSGILIKENRENFEEYMKGYLYYCRLIRLCKGDFAKFEFVGLKEMSEFLQDLTLKKVFELLITSQEEQRQEILGIISWIIAHNQITHDELLSQYFDYCLEALCNYKPESLSFLERLNKTKRYDRTIENIQAFSLILSCSNLQQTAGKICLNYLKNNEVPRYTQCILLILAYFLISQDPKPLLNRLLGVSIQFISKIVHDIGTRGGQKSHQEIWLDQVCLMVLGFEWHPCILLGLSEALSKQKGLWKSLYGNFGKRWGYKFVEKMVMVGHSLPPLEAELLEQPVILGSLCYVRAMKHLEALIGDGKRGCLIGKIEEIGGVVVKDLSLIGEQLLCSHKYFMMARKSGLARKALNQLALIYKAMSVVEKK